jgi:PAP2 superfamily
VSLHVGIPVLVAAAAIWMLPRSPLAWATVIYPLFVLAIVVGTANHFFLDAVVGGGGGVRGERRGDVLRGLSPSGTPGRARVASVWASA